MPDMRFADLLLSARPNTVAQTVEIEITGGGLAVLTMADAHILWSQIGAALQLVASTYSDRHFSTTENMAIIAAQDDEAAAYLDGLMSDYHI